MAKPGSFNAQDSARKNISPGFSTKDNKNPIKASENDADAQKAEAAKEGKNPENPAAAAEAGLNDAEENAANQEFNDADGVSEISEKESSPTDKIVNKVASTSLVGKFAAKKLKGKGPVATIVLLLFATLSLMFGAQSLMPFSLVEQLKEKYDGLNISATLRSNKIFAMQLNRQGIKPATKAAGIFGTKGNYYNLSKKQQQRLANQGIVMEELDLGNGNKKNVLLYDNGSGAQHIVAADVGDIDAIKAKFGADVGEIDIGGNKVKVDLGDVDTFQNKFSSDTNFRNGYTKESLTWRGSVGHWFDTQTAKFLNLFALTRKIFGGFINRVQGINEGNTLRQSVIDTIKNSGAQSATVGDLVDESYGAEDKTRDAVYENGELKQSEEWTENPRGMAQDEGIQEKLNSGKTKWDGDSDNIPTTKHGQGGLSLGVGGTSLSVAKQKAQKVAEFAGSKAVGKASAGIGIACAALNVVNVATLISAAQEMMQILKVATSLSESTDKVTAGDGDGSLNVLGNGLTEEITTTIWDENGISYQSDTPKSAMMSNGIQSLYANTPINPYDKSVASFSFGDVFRSLSGIAEVAAAFASSDFTFYACSIAKIAINTIQTVGTIASCIVSFGLGCIVGSLSKTAATIAIQTAISSFVVPKITGALVNKFTRDLVSELAGENFGNALVSGSHMYMSSNFRNGGGALTNLLSYIAYRSEQEKVIAERAEYIRSTKSPFDPTSQYTFLGSIMKQIITLSTYSNKPTNIISGLSSVVNGSILAMIPSASAADEITSDLIPEDDFNSSCPYLASIGAYGDAYCNPYIITDKTTMNTAPDVIEEAVSSQLDDNGQIKKGSDLSKYVLYCGQRTSPFGLNDNNIANSVSEATPIDGYLGYVPIVGDLVGIYNEEEKIRNMGWISGENCVDASTNTNWETNKVYQRYVEDQRLMESMSDQQSTVSLFLDKYYEEHPLDNSYEGVLARFTGQTKEDVTLALMYMDYEKYVAQYDPTDRYVFMDGFMEEEEPVFFEFEEQPTVALQQHEIIYADTRNRAFAMA